MPVNAVEDTSLDLLLTEESSVGWEKLAAATSDMGGAFLWCQPGPPDGGCCGTDCGC